MPKLTPTERLAKIDEAITKEELAIEASKEKIKTLKAERKKVEQENDQSFANEIMKLMKSKGLSREAILQTLADAKQEESNSSSPAVTETAAQSAADSSAPHSGTGTEQTSTIH